MKKLLVTFVLVCTFILFSVSSALAASAYWDFILSGSYESEIGNTDYDGDTKGVAFGIEYPTNEFNLSLEILSGEGEADGRNEDFDFSAFVLKGGLLLLKEKALTLDATLSYYSSEFENVRDGADLETTALLIGLDGRYNISKDLYLQGSVAISLLGESEIGSSDEDTDLITFKAKLNYLFTDTLGGSLGYRYSKTTTDFGPTKIELKQSALTLGAFLKF